MTALDCSYNSGDTNPDDLPPGARAFPHLDINPAVVCWEGRHKWEALLGFVGFGIYFPTATCTPFQVLFPIDDLDIQFTPLFIMFVQMVKFLLLATSTFFSNTPILYLPLGVILNLILVAALNQGTLLRIIDQRRMVSRSQKISQNAPPKEYNTTVCRPASLASIVFLRTILISAASWAAFCALLNISLPEDWLWLPISILVFGWGVFIMFMIVTALVTSYQKNLQDDVIDPDLEIE